MAACITKPRQWRNSGLIDSVCLSQQNLFLLCVLWFSLFFHSGRQFKILMRSFCKVCVIYILALSEEDKSMYVIGEVF